MSVWSVGLFGAHCGVSGDCAEESACELCARAVTLLTRLPAPALRHTVVTLHGLFEEHIRGYTWDSVDRKVKPFTPSQGDKKGKTSAAVCPNNVQLSSLRRETWK